MGNRSSFCDEPIKTNVMTPLGLRKKIAASFMIIFFIWLTGLLWFYLQIPKSTSKFPENAADAIIVLTGASGRLEYGAQLLAEKKAPILFVSGTGDGVTVGDILHRIPDSIRTKINGEQVSIGSQAENTIGNAQEIKFWLAKTQYKNLLLVTSSYHIPRSLLELSTAIPTATFTPAPVIDNDKELALSEYHKFLAAKLRHYFITKTENK